MCPYPSAEPPMYTCSKIQQYHPLACRGYRSCPRQSMMRGTRLRRALRRQPCKQALSSGGSSFATVTSGVPPHSPTSKSSTSSTSSKSSSAVREPAANNGAAQETTAAKRVVAPRRSEWRPSEAHRESATSIARKENAHFKAATTSRVAGPTAAMDGTGKPTSAGLRRRKLLGGAEYVPSPAQLAAASGVPSPASSSTAKSMPAAAAAAGGAGTPSMVTFSATSRFRARQALERLAAAGDTEAIEALRASTPPSSTSASGRGDGTTGGGRGGDGGGLTPSIVLPFLLALVGAGYCVVNDLVPHEWLSWAGIDGGGGGAGEGDGSGEPSPAGGTRAGDESSLSPLLRTLSGVAAFVPMASSTRKTSTDGRGGSEGEAASTIGAATGRAGAGEARPEGKHQAEEQGGGWTWWGWWTGGRAPDGADTPPPAGSADEEGGTVVLRGGRKDSDSDCSSLAVAGGEEGHRGEGQGDEARPNEEPSEQQQRQRPPRWLRWGASPPASASSGSS